MIGFLVWCERFEDEILMGWLLVGMGFKRTYLADGIISAFGTYLAGSDLRHFRRGHFNKQFQGFGHRFSHMPSQSAQSCAAYLG
jgi:hypothetical protein